MQHVGVNGLLTIDTEIPKGAVRMSKGSGVVDAKQRHLSPRGRPSHHPSLVDSDWPSADVRHLRF